MFFMKSKLGAQSLEDTVVVTRLTRNSEFWGARVVYHLAQKLETKDTKIVTHLT